MVLKNVDQAKNLYRQSLSYEEWYDLSRDMWLDLVAYAKANDTAIDQLSEQVRILANRCRTLDIENKRQQEEIETLEKIATGLSNDLDDFGERNEDLKERAEKAEAEAAEKYCGDEYEHCKLPEIIDELVAECKRQQADIDQLTTALADSGKIIQITPVSTAISEARAEAARWQAAALCKPRVWLMTEERIGALKHLLEMVEDREYYRDEPDSMMIDLATILRAMLAEAKQE